MTTQYTPILQLALPVTGELNGTWGDVVNDNITSMVEEAIAGLATISTWTTNAHTLTTADGVTDEARCAMLVLQTGSGGTALSAAGQVICPARTKLYVVKNDAAYAVTVKTSGGSGVAIAAGDTAFVFCDGTNVNACVTQIINGHITGNLTVDGNTTLGDSSADTVTINAGSTTLNDGGAIRFEDNAGGEYVAIKAPATVTATYTLTLPIDDGTNGQALITDGSGNLSWSTAASGDVYGPASATDNAVARFDLTTGKLIQNSGVIIDDSNNVTGVVNLTSSGSVTLSGGTANGVAYLDGSKVLTTGSALTFDGTGLGVGAATTANYPLTLRSGSGDYTKVLDWGTQTGGSWGTMTIAVSAPPYQTIINTSGLQFNISNAEQMRLTSTGLGIGTSSPSYKLNIVGSGTTALTAVQNTSSFTGGTNFTTPHLYVYSGNDTTGNVTRFGMGVGSGAQVYLDALMEDSVTVYSSLLFRTRGAGGATEKMRLDSSGNLGLGVTPSAWSGYGAVLEIKGSASINSTTTFLQVGSNYYYNGTNTIYKTTQAAAYYQQNAGIHSWHNAPSGSSGTTATFTQAMTLDSSGNLNLGLTSGTARASIVGGALSTNNGVSISNGLTNGRLITGSSNVNSIHTYYGNEFLEVSVGSSHIVGTVYDGTYASPNMRFFTDSTERMRIDSSGNLGLGVTPSAWSTVVPAMELGSAGTFIAAQGSAPVLRVGSNAYYNGGWLYKISGYASRYDQASGAHAWYTAPSGTAGAAITFTQAMTLDASGNLTLGKTSADGKLDIAGITGAGAYSFVIGYGANGDNYYTSGSSGIHVFRASGTERMRIDSSGNVGIGTSSPASFGAGYKTLDIVGTSGAGIVQVGSTSVQARFQADQIGAVFLNAVTAHPLTFGTNNTERMRIDSSGNVGIGVTTIASASAARRALQISNGTSGGIIYLSNDGTESNNPRIFGSGSTQYDLGFAAGSSTGIINWYTNGTERMRIDSSGNVTIAQAGRATITTDNDGSFDMNAASNFKCTPTGTFALTFTNIASAGGQSGYILLVNTGGYAITAAATTKVGSSFLSTVSTAGTYLLSYFSDATNVYVTTSGALS